MKTKSIFLLSAIAAFFIGTAGMARTASDGLTRYVNQYIGTGGHGHVFLGANVPFGLVQLADGTGARAITTATRC